MILLVSQKEISNINDWEEHDIDHFVLLVLSITMLTL